jgi:hypothetical protein
MYEEDEYFKEAYASCENHVSRDRSPWIYYMLQEGFLFKGIQLCIPKCSMREYMLQEKHSGGLARHFEKDKTFAQSSVFFFFFGQVCTLMWINLWKCVGFFSMRRERARTLGYIILCQFQENHG